MRAAGRESWRERLAGPLGVDRGKCKRASEALVRTSGLNPGCYVEVNDSRRGTRGQLTGGAVEGQLIEFTNLQKAFRLSRMAREVAGRMPERELVYEPVGRAAENRRVERIQRGTAAQQSGVCGAARVRPTNAGGRSSKAIQVSYDSVRGARGQIRICG